MSILNSQRQSFTDFKIRSNKWRQREVWTHLTQLDLKGLRGQVPATSSMIIISIIRRGRGRVPIYLTKPRFLLTLKILRSATVSLINQKSILTIVMLSLSRKCLKWRRKCQKLIKKLSSNNKKSRTMIKEKKKTIQSLLPCFKHLLMSSIRGPIRHKSLQRNFPRSHPVKTSIST